VSLDKRVTISDIIHSGQRRVDALSVRQLRGRIRQLEQQISGIHTEIDNLKERLRKFERVPPMCQ